MTQTVKQPIKSAQVSTDSIQKIKIGGKLTPTGSGVLQTTNNGGK